MSIFIVKIIINKINNKSIVITSLLSLRSDQPPYSVLLVAKNIISTVKFEVETLTELKVKNLFICGILISCMGAVMDVAMSISSAIEELRVVNKDIKAITLFKSAMNIGRDAMGTMANTLILAFAGNSLNMMILICSYGVSFQQLINTDFVAIEIISAIAGSIGIILAVPLVSFIGAYGVFRVMSPSSSSKSSKL